MNARRFRISILGGVALILAAAPLAAQPAAPPASGDAPAPSAAEREAAARKYFTDVPLINQDGEPMRLYSDLLRGRTVVVNAFFTSCTGVCPVMGQKLKAIQERFADHLGKDLALISISVDPETDTVPKLKAYAERMGAKPGWYFLAGDKANVDQALYKLGQYVEDKEAHTNIMIIGNEATGLWVKAFGLKPAPELIDVVQQVLDDDGTG
ncbi:MAG: SCO family protein [Acidobacteria bacterium]|nr:MAG: SCO family protein [Acidobacteriota bacterium]